MSEQVISLGPIRGEAWSRDRACPTSPQPSPPLGAEREVNSDLGVQPRADAILLQ
jgi:hypothetical protein